MSQTAPEYVSPGESSGKTVLIIEDDAAILELVKTRLELAGLSTLTAQNGEEGLERAAEFIPDAIVLDMNMPIMDGYGVLEGLRNSTVLARVPTLVLTCRSKPNDVARAIQLGAKDYLTKPFDNKQLVQRVGRLMHTPDVRPPDRGDASDIFELD